MSLLLLCHSCAAHIAVYEVRSIADVYNFAQQQGWNQLDSRWRCEKCSLARGGNLIRPCFQTVPIWLRGGSRRLRAVGVLDFRAKSFESSRHSSGLELDTVAGAVYSHEISLQSGEPPFRRC